MARNSFKEHRKDNLNSKDTSKQNSKNKENICLRLRKRGEKDEKNKSKLNFKEDSDFEFEKMLSSFQKEEFNSKPLTFWGKKLQDLESQNNNKKKCKLYEFSGTDDSASPYKKKKIPKKKCSNQKKKCHPKPSVNELFKKATTSKTKAKENHRQSFFREQVMLNKEREKLTNEKFTFSTDMPFLGVTSTPATNKVNLVGASSFLFLSPVMIIREVDESCNMKDGECISDSKVILNAESQTPKRENKLHGVNARVLRSRTVKSYKLK